ncbi:MAG: DUF721 domain-containing protein [Phycisphaeraceae bacterium]|nr:DUF721 domain-containing protein [Phycisphaeraceae bacterium]
MAGYDSGMSEGSREKDEAKAADMKLQRLRQWRNRPEKDLTLSGLDGWFNRQIARPHKQLAGIIDVWISLVPAEVTLHCRLQSLIRGVLTVTVDSSPHRYELDRLLREGLEAKLVEACGGTKLRKVKLTTGK